MKTKLYISLFAIGLLSTACVEDETNYDITPINEISIGGLEENYYGMAYNDVISIKPEITGSLTGDDLSNYEYTWYRCGGNHVHDTISHEKDLEWLAQASPGTHNLYLVVRDKTTGYEKNLSTNLVLSSPFTRGFLILGNRPHSDNMIGLDMLTMIQGKNDTIYAKDVFDNSETKIRNAKTMYLTGNSRSNRFYIQTEDGTYNPIFTNEQTLESIGEEFNDLGLIECLEPHKTPIKLMGLALQKGEGRYAAALSQAPRFYLTEDQFFGHKRTEKMNQPINRYSNTSKIFFKFYPYIFYNTRRTISHAQTDYSSQYSPVILYDTDNDCFSYVIGTALGFTHMGQISNTVVLQQLGIYLMNQPNGRTLVYGENDHRLSSGRCNFIMKDNDDKYCLYRFELGFPSMGWNHQPSIRNPYFCNLDVASMTGFLDREQIFFASGANSIIYYSVGNTLYAYDYVAKRLESKQFNGNITYLAPDFASPRENNLTNDATNYWVATFDGDKGHLYKMKTIENADKIEFTHLDGQDWEIDLEIKSVLWKDGAIY